ncbi:serine/threonine-protein kinase SRPK1-like protein [Perkinsela sp. CCAP 1560/4]|nr:serine/threonine-protein kinase SRPK1-like protein [Perkinsela sp. CCAP 1560/4]|eukprot:KNH06097.1 serine/threonine-protein kinase SRPK1-like protein [Perkinsela sp. CCAP 1560/4]
MDGENIPVAPTNDRLLNSFERIVHRRYSCKHFDTQRTICPRLLRRILLATLRAPSGFNLQPWVAVMVSMESQRERLYEAALRQKQVLDAPVTVVFACSTDFSHTNNELRRTEKRGMEAGGVERFYFQRNTRFMLNQGPCGIFQKAKCLGIQLYRKHAQAPMLSIPHDMRGYGWKQCMIPATFFMLAATSAGLQTACLEGIDEGLVKKVVGLTPQHSVPCIISIGYEKKPPKVFPTVRRNPKDVFFDGTFGESTSILT